MNEEGQYEPDHVCDKFEALKIFDLLRVRDLVQDFRHHHSHPGIVHHLDQLAFFLDLNDLRLMNHFPHLFLENFAVIQGVFLAVEDLEYVILVSAFLLGAGLYHAVWADLYVIVVDDLYFRTCFSSRLVFGFLLFLGDRDLAHIINSLSMVEFPVHDFADGPCIIKGLKYFFFQLFVARSVLFDEKLEIALSIDVGVKHI